MAKAVMEQLIGDLPDDPNLMAALRIYGAELRSNLTPCEGTVLVQPFAPVAWEGAVNVTGQAQIEIVRSTGEVVQSTRTAQDPPVVRAQVDGGQYTVHGRLAVGSQVLTAQAAGIVAKPGQTSLVRLDFGPLDGRVRVTVRASGQDVSDRVDISVLKAGARQAALVTPGVYAVTAVYRDSESDMYETYVKPGEITDLTLEVKLPGLIAIIPTIEGKPMRTDCCRTSASLDGVSVGTTRVQSDRVELTVPEGTYSVVGEISDPFAQRQDAPGVQVQAGETIQIKMDFDPAGLLRIKVIADGKPLAAGAHDISIQPRGAGIGKQWIRGIEVTGGATVERILEVSSP